MEKTHSPTLSPGCHLHTFSPEGLSPMEYRERARQPEYCTSLNSCSVPPRESLSHPASTTWGRAAHRGCVGPSWRAHSGGSGVREQDHLALRPRGPPFDTVLMLHPRWKHRSLEVKFAPSQLRLFLAA